MAKIFTSFSDQTSLVTEEQDRFVYTIKQCPVCWARHADRAICHGAVGLLQGGVHWVSGGRDFTVVETQCKAKGDEDCVFEIFKEPLN